MSLFKKAKEVKSGLKVLVYGISGSGKSTFALSFPKVCAIDTEDGLSCYAQNPNLEYILTTTSADQVEEALEEIEDELMDEIGTFLLDSETKVYENLQHSFMEVVERRARSKGRSAEAEGLSTREWGKIKLISKRIKATQIMLASRGVNVVSVAQMKDVKEKKGDTFVTVGHMPDANKGIEYDFDIVLQLFTEEDKKSGEVTYKAKVLKDRTQVYKRGNIIENPSYENWREYVEGKANLEVEVKDFKKDIKRDMNLDEDHKAMAIVEEFKAIMKELDEDKKKKVLELVKKQKIDVASPKGDDIKKLEGIITKIKG